MKRGRPRACAHMGPGEANRRAPEANCPRAGRSELAHPLAPLKTYTDVCTCVHATAGRLAKLNHAALECKAATSWDAYESVPPRTPCGRVGLSRAVLGFCSSTGKLSCRLDDYTPRHACMGCKCMCTCAGEHDKCSLAPARAVLGNIWRHPPADIATATPLPNKPAQARRPADLHGRTRLQGVAPMQPHCLTVSLARKSLVPGLGPPQRSSPTAVLHPCVWQEPPHHADCPSPRPAGPGGPEPGL